MAEATGHRAGQPLDLDARGADARRGLGAGGQPERHDAAPVPVRRRLRPEEGRGHLHRPRRERPRLPHGRARRVRRRRALGHGRAGDGGVAHRLRGAGARIQGDLRGGLGRRERHARSRRTAPSRCRRRGRRTASRIAYTSFRSGAPLLYERNLSTGGDRVLSDRGGINITPSYAPDGRTVAFATTVGGHTEIATVGPEGLRQHTRGRGYENLSPTWAPDGRRLAFVSDRLGQPQIYVMSLGGEPRLISEYGNRGYSTSPDWSPAGPAIAYHTRINGRMQVVAVDVDGGRPRVLTTRRHQRGPQLGAGRTAPGVRLAGPRRGRIVRARYGYRAHPPPAARARVRPAGLVAGADAERTGGRTRRRRGGRGDRGDSRRDGSISPVHHR